MDVFNFVAVLLITSHFSEGVLIYLWRSNERDTEGFVEVYYNGTWGFVGIHRLYSFRAMQNSRIEVIDIHDAFDFSELEIEMPNGHHCYIYCGDCRDVQNSEFGYGSSYMSMDYYIGHSWLNGIECIGTETDIEQCIGENEFQYREYSNSLGWEYNYGSKLYCVDSRLKDGLSQSAGVIQTAFFGQIYTICYDGFDMNAANVLCNHLNYNGALHFTWAAPDTTPIFHSQLLCTGNEYSLTECNLSDEEIVNCSHVVNVSCGAVRFTNWNGYDDEGVVEVHYNGSWGLVGEPDFSFDDVTASYLCEKFGFTNGSFSTSAHPFLTYNRKAWLDSLLCNGNETNIGECDHSGYYLVPPIMHTYKSGTWLYCFDFDVTNVRLVNGARSYEGRVELEISGRWGSICTFFMDSTDKENVGEIVCRQLGYEGLETLLEDNIGDSSYVFWMSDIYCMGNESSVTECTYTKGPSASCIDVPVYLAVQCIDFDVTNVRLVNGSRSYEGRVELEINGRWGPICTFFMDYTDEENVGNIVCRQLGYEGLERLLVEIVGDSSNVFWMPDVYCMGNESSVAECTYYKGPSAPCIDYPFYLTVQCIDFDVTNVRLVNGSRSYEGRVELEINGRWGPICTVSMDSTDEENVGNIVCRQLGYEGLERLLVEIVGDSSNVFWMPDVYCMGNESSVAECTYYKGPSAPCIDYSFYLTVQCIDFDVTNVRLVNGSRSYEGRVELEINGRWGPICTFFMDYTDEENVGNIVCRQLGYEGLERLLVEIVGDSSNVFWMPDVYCMGNESSVAECTYYKGPSAPCIDYPFYLTVQCIDTNDCAPSPCVNGGSCEDRVNGYKCYCVSGFEGVNCQIDIDECQSQPCQSNGNCLDDVNGYTCECTQGYEGDRCQIEDESNNSLMVILVSASGGVVVIITLIGFCWCRHRRRKRNNSKTKEVSFGDSRQGHAGPNMDEMPKDAELDGYTNLYNSVKENDGTDGIEVYAEIEDVELNDYLNPVSKVGPKQDDFGYIAYGNEEDGTVHYYSLKDRKNDEYTHISN